LKAGNRRILSPAALVWCRCGAAVTLHGCFASRRAALVTLSDNHPSSRHRSARHCSPAATWAVAAFLSASSAAPGAAAATTGSLTATAAPLGVSSWRVVRCLGWTATLNASFLPCQLHHPHPLSLVSAILVCAVLGRPRLYTAARIDPPPERCPHPPQPQWQRSAAVLFAPVAASSASDLAACTRSLPRLPRSCAGAGDCWRCCGDWLH
jgi:hypothetical protein